MNYQVLARKWRPRTFREMVGQEHVLQALINALDHDRLHHAYLFTGTRGVGKTTIARILAKCLNCEVGVSSSPCNECGACTEINEGRFVDLIEVDAASRTKVEDTRELLENVQYAPTRGRYKVYLIDEVHMLSNSSFNALLKTLEEPPPHVKFLLATTDPQKLPVTILSRCLQFNLKNLSPERIVTYLQSVLDSERVPFEDPGLWHLARSADGSMRDALSLTDQAISFGDGKITELDVRTMLGSIDQSLVYDVLAALIAEDVKQLLGAVEKLAEHSPDYLAALADMIMVLHRIAIAQALPEAIDNSRGDRQQIYKFAQSISVEDVQLYYQTALLGRRDLPLAPDLRSGFEMILLRMLAFKPQGVSDVPEKTLVSEEPQVQAEPEQPLAAQEAEDTVKKPEAALEKARLELEVVTAAVISPQPKADIQKPHEQTTQPDNLSANNESQVDHVLSQLETPEEDSSAILEESASLQEQVDSPDIAESPLAVVAQVSLDELNNNNWFDVYSAIKTGGLLQSTVANTEFLRREGNHLFFRLDEQQSTLYDVRHQEQLAEQLNKYFSQSVEVSIELGVLHSESPAQRVIREQQARQQQARVAISNDPVVVQLQETLGATVIDDSVSPIDK